MRRSHYSLSPWEKIGARALAEAPQQGAKQSCKAGRKNNLLLKKILVACVIGIGPQGVGCAPEAFFYGFDVFELVQYNSVSKRIYVLCSALIKKRFDHIEIVLVFTGKDIFADASIAVPLLRDAGREVVKEPLTQAEQDILYAIWEFERFKKNFAIRVAFNYLEALQTQDRIRNAEEN